MIYTDQHIHCQCSPDSHTPLREMAAAARDHGMVGKAGHAQVVVQRLAARMQALIDPVLVADSSAAATTDRNLSPSALPNLAYV